MARQNLRYVDGSPVVEERPDDYFLRQVGPGWAPLVTEFLRLMEAHDGVVDQVKEKFGTLRLYYEGPPSEDLCERVITLENWSSRRCEQCGAPGVLRQGGWLKTLCEGHAAGRPAYAAQFYNFTEEDDA